MLRANIFKHEDLSSAPRPQPVGVMERHHRLVPKKKMPSQNQRANIVIEILLKFVFNIQNGGQHCRGQGGRRIVITSRIIRAFADGNIFDYSVDSVNGEAFTAPNYAHAGWPGVRQLHVELGGEVPKRVRQKGKVARTITSLTVFDALVLGPSRHHGAVIDTVNDGFVDTRLLQTILCV